MNSLRAFQRTFQTATTTSLRNTSRNYSSFAVRPRSPFLELLGRYRSRRPEKHLFLRRRNFASQAEQKNVPSPKPGSPTDPNRSFSQRFKDLTRKYGWAALGTYFALSILDYPFFFLAVRSVGTDRIGQYEHAVSEWIKATVPFEIPTIQWPWQKQGAESEGSENQKEGEASQKKDLESEKKTEASLWTQALIAYALHKSFIFLRIPLAVAVTPKVVKTLRSFGWNVGNRAPKAKTIATQTGK